MKNKIFTFLLTVGLFVPVYSQPSGNFPYVLNLSKINAVAAPGTVTAGNVTTGNVTAGSVISDRVTPATPSKCMQFGPGATSYTVTATSGTPIAILGLLPTSGGFLLVSCSNGDQAVVGLPIGGAFGICALTWSTGASLAVTTPVIGKWAVDYSGGWRINNQVGTAGTSTLSYTCVLIGGP